MYTVYAELKTNVWSWSAIYQSNNITYCQWLPNDNAQKIYHTKLTYLAIYRSGSQKGLWQTIILRSDVEEIFINTRNSHVYIISNMTMYICSYISLHTYILHSNVSLHLYMAAINTLNVTAFVKTCTFLHFKKYLFEIFKRNQASPT